MQTKSYFNFFLKNKWFLFVLQLLILFEFFGYILVSPTYAYNSQIIGKALCVNTGSYLNFTEYNANVNVNLVDGVFSGYAFSEDLGWVAFGINDNPQGPVTVNVSTGEVSGKAKVLSTGSFIDFDGYNSDVDVNTQTGALTGWVWSEDVGWLNFSDVGVFIDNFPLNFDINPPILSSISSSIADTSVTITWTTDEASSSQLQYGLTSSLGVTTAVTDTSPNVTSHTVSLSSLLPCTVYYCRAISEDSANNQGIGDILTSITSGCGGHDVGSSTSAFVLSQITNSVGGGVTLASLQSNLELILPPSVKSSLSSNTAIDYQIKLLTSAPILSVLSVPSDSFISDSNTNLNQLISSIFDLKAYTGVGVSLSSFDQPITINITYNDDQVSDVDLATLAIYRHNGTSWSKLATAVDAVNHKLTATTTNFSLFGIFGQTYAQSSSSSSSVSSSTPGSHCPDAKPVSTPSLFQINVTSNTAKLFFTPITNTNSFYVSFSESSDAEKHGEKVTLLKEGVQSHNIYHLKSNTTYYVKVRGQNGCLSGEWSNIMKIKTTTNSTQTRISYSYHAVTNFLNRLKTNIFSPVSKKPSSLTITPTPNKIAPLATITPAQKSNEATPSLPKKKCFVWWCW